MPMTRGTPLVATVAAAVKLTGQQGLNNIPNAASELTVVDLLTTASDVIYDKLESHGIDPTALTNQVVYERAVAWHFLSMVAEMGLLLVGGESAQESADRYERKADRYFMEVLPKTTDTDTSRRGNESVPRVGNLTKKAQINPIDSFYDDLQSRL